MTRRDYFIRLGISVLIDLGDLFIGSLPGIGIATDSVATVILYMLWGRAGLAYAWEVIDIIEPTDAIIPTATLIGLYVGWREGMFGGKRKTDSNTEVSP
jgi:hypothetical protein